MSLGIVLLSTSGYCRPSGCVDPRRTTGPSYGIAYSTSTLPDGTVGTILPRRRYDSIGHTEIQTSRDEETRNERTVVVNHQSIQPNPSNPACGDEFSFVVVDVKKQEKEDENKKQKTKKKPGIGVDHQHIRFNLLVGTCLYS